MKKYFGFSLIVCLISILSFSAGYLVGDFQKDERDEYVQEMLGKQIEALDRVTDANMYSSEPYNSYMLSVLLLEGIIEEPDSAQTHIKSILIKELSSRKNAVRSYCSSRATEEFRSACDKTIERAEQLIERSST